MEIYIKGIGIISPQNTFNNEHFLEEIAEYQDDYLKCIEPVYKKYIKPMLLRRMSRIIKMGIYAAKTSLDDANIDIPDAIITGTGLGCIEDTEKFLFSMITNNEELLPPTPFIQSTHNTISAQIALMLKCHNYNNTYVHRGISFESALLDSMMLLKENSINNILTGAADEITHNSFLITKRLGHWKNPAISNLKLLDYKTRGSIAGEGAAFFVLTNTDSKHNYAKISSVSTFYKPENYKIIEDNITEFLKNAKIDTNDIDLIIFGINGDTKFDKIYYHLIKNYFENKDFVYYKHLCGEYHTSTSFVLWLSAKILKNQFIPEIIKLNKEPDKPVKNILIYNHYRNINHSLILISGC
ncbi:MAG: beta-ketoacyl synthase chain length factor [Bacteroidales bacterium]|nr:beta-ketoacyl synthase chain length factor [Bacteroidales bacterium]